jgi:His/Glu/Gln/Arg/opine family amino acid ABC transporter permease subunit
MFSIDDPATLEWLDGLPTALLGTVAIWALSACLGVAVGLVLALTRLSAVGPLARLAQITTDVGRSVPLLVVLYLTYFGILALWFPIDPFWAASAAIGARLGFLLSEIFRAGIQSVPPGLVEAAQSLGMSSATVQRRVVLPIAFRIMLPAIGQYIVGALLDSAYASVIGGSELTQHSRIVIDIMFAEYVWIYVGLAYLLLTFPISRAFAFVERRWAIQL